MNSFSDSLIYSHICSQSSQRPKLTCLHFSTLCWKIPKNFRESNSSAYSDEEQEPKKWERSWATKLGMREALRISSSSFWPRPEGVFCSGPMTSSEAIWSWLHRGHVLLLLSTLPRANVQRTLQASPAKEKLSGNAEEPKLVLISCI